MILVISRQFSHFTSFKQNVMLIFCWKNKKFDLYNLLWSFMLTTRVSIGLFWLYFVSFAYSKVFFFLCCYLTGRSLIYSLFRNHFFHMYCSMYYRWFETTHLLFFSPSPLMTSIKASNHLIAFYSRVCFLRFIFTSHSLSHQVVRLLLSNTHVWPL